MKRLLYAFIIILIVFLIIYLGFKLGYKSNPISQTNSTSTTGQTGGFPSDQNAGIGSSSSSTLGEGTSVEDVLTSEVLFGKVLDRPVSSYQVTPSSTIVFVEPDGKIGVASGTVVETLSSSPIPNLLRSSISYGGEKALVIIGSNSEQASIFDTKTRVWELLPKDAREPVWSPRGQEVAYLSYRVDGAVDLIALNLQPAKHTSRTLLTFNGYDLRLDWKNPDVITISERATTKVPTSAWLFNIKTKTLTTVARDEKGSETIWDPSATVGLALTSNAPYPGGYLTLRSNTGVIKSNFSLLTLPAKCLFAPSATSSLQFTVPSAYLICGIPRNYNAIMGADIPDIYNKWGFYGADDLYRINLSNANIELLRSKDDESLDVLKLSVVSSTLFFVNRYDNYLYFLKLPKEQ